MVKTKSTKKTHSAKSSSKSASRTKKISDEDRMIAMLSHLLGLLISWGWLGPLIIFLVKKDEPGIVRDNARHSLNFQLSMLIYFIVSGMLVFVFVGFPLIIVLGIFALVTPIIGSVRAYEGKVYEYPLEIKFINR
ncbi:MAG: DUF4870 domain-containing protein [Candidatus Woesearchaeota archaeon]